MILRRIAEDLVEEASTIVTLPDIPCLLEQPAWAPVEPKAERVKLKLFERFDEIVALALTDHRAYHVLLCATRHELQTGTSASFVLSHDIRY